MGTKTKASFGSAMDGAQAVFRVTVPKLAQSLRIKLELVHRELHISLEDDGCGFSMTEVKWRNNSNGWVNMEKRHHDLGGQLRIESAVGQGTRIDVKLHLPRN